jgi:hypothetical protein
MSTPPAIDLPVDLSTMDDTGLPWSFLDESAHPERIVPGAFIVVGEGDATAVAQVVDVEGGIVHVLPLRGSVASNAHRLSPPFIAS